MSRVDLTFCSGDSRVGYSFYAVRVEAVMNTLARSRRRGVPLFGRLFVLRLKSRQPGALKSSRCRYRSFEGQTPVQILPQTSPAPLVAGSIVTGPSSGLVSTASATLIHTDSWSAAFQSYMYFQDDPAMRARCDISQRFTFDCRRRARPWPSSVLRRSRRSVAARIRI